MNTSSFLPTTPRRRSRNSPVCRPGDIRYLAALYGDPGLKVTSYWCMGFNQHTRGTWINNLVYNIHLLVGKIPTPGNSPFSLTGQPSACGTVREVGTLTHALPHGVVTNEEDRKRAAEIWKRTGRSHSIEADLPYRRDVPRHRSW